MVLTSEMKNYKINILFFVFAILFSCENDWETVNDISFIDCNECSVEEPLTAKIRIKLSDPFKFGTANSVILIEIYEGMLEDNVLFASIQTTSLETSFNLPVNKIYTFSAIYSIDNKIYKVINSVTPRVKYAESSCDEPCYYTVPRVANLRLKYAK